MYIDVYLVAATMLSGCLIVQRSTCQTCHVEYSFLVSGAILATAMSVTSGDDWSSWASHLKAWTTSLNEAQLKLKTWAGGRCSVVRALRGPSSRSKAGCSANPTCHPLQKCLKQQLSVLPGFATTSPRFGSRWPGVASLAACCYGFCSI